MKNETLLVDMCALPFCILVVHLFFVITNNIVSRLSLCLHSVIGVTFEKSSVSPRLLKVCTKCRPETCTTRVNLPVSMYYLPTATEVGLSRT